MLLFKLLEQVRDRWNRETYFIRARHFREPELKDLINYVDKGITLINYQVFPKKPRSRIWREKMSELTRSEGLEAMIKYKMIQ